MKKHIILFAVYFSFTTMWVAADNNGEIIDGSTKETTVASLKKMQNSLGNKDRCFLQSGMIRISLGDPSLKEGNKLGEKIDGLNADQVIALSEKYDVNIVNLCRD